MRRITPILAVALGAGVALAQARPRVVPTRPLAWVSSRSMPKTRGQVARYSATKIQVLVFSVRMSPAVRGSHTLGLRVFTPRGHLYQTLSVPFVVPEPPRYRRAPALSHTVLSVRLPVAGTPIVANSLYGRWRVEPHLDDAEAPCGPDHLFSITR